MMRNKLLLIFFACAFVFCMRFVLSEELFTSCGGDDELNILCIGDDQLFYAGHQITTQQVSSTGGGGSITGQAIQEPAGKKIANPFLFIILILIVFAVALFLNNRNTFIPIEKRQEKKRVK